MCGIAGFCDFTGKSSAVTLKTMTDVLTHRGPDDSNYELFETQNYSVGLGHRRLSILDLSMNGRQPMNFNHKHIIFNGEVYNFKEIREELIHAGYHFNSESDTEVILKGFDYQGIDFLNKMIGMFAIAIYDEQEEKLYLMRDRVGVKPLYYSITSEGMIFGSELKALVAYPGFNKSIDKNSLGLFLQYNYVPTPYTIYEKVYKLKPGHVGIFDLPSRDFRLRSYWDVYDYYNQPFENVDEAEVIEYTRKLLDSAINYRMVSDVPVGMFLSGGYDSTCVAAFLQKDRTEKIKTFTIGYQEEGFNEAPEARKISEFLGTDHTEWIVTANDAKDILTELPIVYDEPFADNSVVPTILVSRLARSQVKVSLSADGGDEIFGGYHKYDQSIRYSKLFPQWMNSISSKVMNQINPNQLPWFNKQYNFSTRYQKFQDILSFSDPLKAMTIINHYITRQELSSILPIQDSLNHKTYYDDIELGGQVEDLNKVLALDFKTFLLDNNLTKVDRASMSVGLEGRDPLLDHRIIEYVSRLPAKYKIRDGVFKYLLKEIVYDMVPREMMERPKKPFIAPLTVWFKNDLRSMLTDHLSENSLKEQGIFQSDAVIKMRDSYLRGDKVSHQKVWNLLVFQLWYNQWMK